MDLRENMPLPDAMGHWYYRSKFAAMEHALPWPRLRTVLDFGCGRGVFARLLKQQHPHLEVVAYDPNGPEVVEDGVQFLRTKPAEDFDAILLMDVLEHVPDPLALLDEVRSCCHKGTEVFVTVPAFRMLWSGHDDYLGHHRRYTLGELMEQARATGFSIRRSHYLFSHLLLPALIRRRILKHNLQSDMNWVAPWLNHLLYLAGLVEGRLAPFNRLAGLTAVVRLHT
jgi:2-polyprenyl-3-methyl-5-hydroxy-6-metoxy-1,4-benzoquinol methylase